MKILLLQYQMLGDVLTSSVIAQQLKLIYPDSHIDYLIIPHAAALVDQHPHIDGLIKVSKEAFSGWKSIISLSRKIKASKYDLLIDPYCKNNSALLSVLSGIPKRIGYKKWFSRLAYTHALENKPDLNIFKTGVSIGSRLLLTQPLTDTVQWNLKPKIYLTEEERTAGRTWLKNQGLNIKGAITMVSVLGSSLDKTLPFETMAKVIDQHVKETGTQVLFNYIPSQKQEALAIYNHCNTKTQSHIYIDAFAPSIRDFLKVLSQCTAIIGNEGGAINMGKALDIPTLSIYSPWVKKQSWNVGEDGKNHISVHLQDFKPQLYGDVLPKKLKHKASEFYKELDASLIMPSLKVFEGFHY